MVWAAAAARCAPAGTSGALRALSKGERPPDRRLGELRTLDSHCPFTPPATVEAWRARAAMLRRQVRVALGLWPWPTRTPLEAVVTGTIEREGYVVERVAIQSVPGHFVTGNVYRPTGRSGRLPAVLSPHGHWPGGRFQDIDTTEVNESLASGGERLEVAAHHILQARAVHLARLGALVFLIDLEGYADSQQLGLPLVHEFAQPRPAMEGRDSWGFFSPQAELHQQSVLGLVAWNAERALDYLASRPDVDPARIGVTGASGGGTQTFLLGTIDDRPAALFPAVMVSTHMQGGCTCENASYLRIGTGNAEIAATIAPRPLGMTSADDWTKEFDHDGYPDVQRVFGLFGATDKVRLSPFLKFPHNYNAPSRAAMYDWFNTHLGLGWTVVPEERDFVPLTTAEASVWDAAHPAPNGGPDHERALLAWLARDARASLDALTPRDAASWQTYRETIGGAWEVMLGGAWPEGDAARFDERRRVQGRLGSIRLGLILRDSTGAAIPTAIVAPAGTPRGIVVWTDPSGKASLEREDARPMLQALLGAGYEVIAIDALEQGEYRADGDSLTRVRLAHTRAHAGYTFAYNLPLPAARAQDVLTAVRVAREHAGANGRVLLVGRGAAAAWAAGARMLAGAIVDGAALDFDGFRFDAADRIDAPDLLPGAAKYGDVEGLASLALGAGPVWLGRQPSAPALVAAVRTARGDRVSVVTAEPFGPGAVDWLMR